MENERVSQAESGARGQSLSGMTPLILASSSRHMDQMVVRPGAENGEKVAFGSLSRTGGIVNAYAALKMADGYK